MDKVNTFKEEILKTVGDQIDRQNNKGLEKYGHSLEKCDPGEYDWNQMIIEELVDALQYQQKEIARLRETKEITLHEYQELSKRTQPLEGSKADISNYAMGLAGENGELIDLLKKYLYHGHSISMKDFINEAGDVLHYLSGLCTMFAVDLEGVAASNLRKLQLRYPNGFSKEDSINRTV